ncbi:MAG: AAA family ATPase [Planctomycetota bacterium]|nr:AAA family ATPase [Planctomycetota bacterium]
MSDVEVNRDIEQEIESLREGFTRLRESVGASFLGHHEVVELLLLSVLADGHVLLEGAPGLGKTTLVKSLAAALGLSFGRIQFTPDLMPGDILGMRVLVDEPDGGRSFRFEPGPVFVNLLLADEINRATPRTQSALLEAMQERQVTMFGETRKLDDPFFVIATQNPIEMEGTYPLPEAQLDRFLCKIEIDSPAEDELMEILKATTTTGGAAPAGQSIEAKALRRMRTLVRALPTSSDIVRLAARIVLCTDPRREDAPEDVRRYLRYGASPRGGQAILLLGKARALVNGRPWVSEEDIEKAAAPSLRHRVVYSYEGEASGVHPDELVAQALARARELE